MFNYLITKNRMKKLFMVLAVLGFITFSAQYVMAQTSAAAQTTETIDGEPLHEYLKTKMIEGGAGYMGLLLFLLILGLGIVIERVIYLSLASVNSKKLLSQIEEALSTGGVEAAKEICRNTRGPVASIFYQGLLRMDQGIEAVEKSIVAYGGVQMNQLEKGLSWIQLFIAVLPMIGFLGTVIGMVITFDDIAIAGDISPNIVASGMKFALLTTVAALVGAIPLQFCYNYLIAKLDTIVLEMEDASISFIDLLVKRAK